MCGEAPGLRLSQWGRALHAMTLAWQKPPHHHKSDRWAGLGARLREREHGAHDAAVVSAQRAQRQVRAQPRPGERAKQAERAARRAVPRSRGRHAALGHLRAAASLWLLHGGPSCL